MPQSGMDLWVIAGVLIAAVAAVFAWRQSRGHSKAQTKNRIDTGHRNNQSGGRGTTENTIKNGDNNTQRGA